MAGRLSWIIPVRLIGASSNSRSKGYYVAGTRIGLDVVVYDFRDGPIGSVIEGPLIVWLTWTPEDLQNQSRWLLSLYPVN